MSHPNQPSRKGKEVVHEHRASKQSRTSYVPRPPTGFSIHEPSSTPVISSSDEEEGDTEFCNPYTTEFHSNHTNNVVLRGEGSNGSKHVDDVMGSSVMMMTDQRQHVANILEERNRARRERDRARRNSLTTEQKEEINARRRAARQNKDVDKKEEINASRRRTRQNKALDERNARQRANLKNMSAEERQEMNANIRGRMQSLPRHKREELLAKRKANGVARRNTPCADSIAMPCPNTTTLATVNLAKKEAALPPASPSHSTLDYTIGSNDDMEAFLSRLMDENAIPDDLMDEQYYLYATEGSDADDMELDETSDLSGMSSADPFDFVYTNLPESTNILEKVPNCKFCNAKRFEREPLGFCCLKGDIKLSEQEPIPELMRLWSSTDADCWHFRDSIRFFNGHFSFTTLGVTLDNSCTNMSSGVYTFQASGSVYHNVHSFGPGSRPDHLQLYFYDDDPSLIHRKEATKQLDQDVVRTLTNIMRENPYSQQLRSLGAHRDNLQDYRIELNTDQKLDQRTYNLPISSEVAAIWIEGSDLANRFKRSITLHGNNNERYSIQATQGCYDPLSYPLFFPKGELGWHPNIPKDKVSWDVAQLQRAGRNDNQEGGGRLCVSVRDYYCYMLQTRPGIFNPILHGGRLFQQWGVDMYIKIEGCRLKWVRDHQPEICADLYKGIVDSITAGETRASAVGTRTVLPHMFQGGFRDMKRRHMDAMALVHTYGKPDIFLTMTCNPNWQEIQDELFPGQTPQDRPDLVARVILWPECLEPS